MRTIITLFLFVVSFNISNAQIIGKIFDKDFADKEFGEVVNLLKLRIIV